MTNLRDYVQHKPDCDVEQCSVCYLDADEHDGRLEEDYDEDDHDFAPMPCTCGLDALLSASPHDGWRPIETHDGSITPVLVAGGDDIGMAAEARYLNDEDGWWLSGSHPTDACGPDRIYPTHWMPMPAFPAPPVLPAPESEKGDR